MSLHFGVDYYPEHWNEDRWETDCTLMREMGVQFVRMAEFSWAKMEPSESVFNFDRPKKIGMLNFALLTKTIDCDIFCTRVYSDEVNYG